MDAIKNLAVFAWLRGYRTYVISAFIILGFVVEVGAEIDIPGATFSWELVLVALGLGTARNGTT
jgi:hypothetical protein